MTIGEFKKITPYVWEVPRSFRKDMKVPARIYASQKMLTAILDERSVEQLINVATLPGIDRYALAMPDIHQGYGFPIGGVAPIRAEDGVISPGGVGYDINCGVRLLRSTITKSALGKHLEALSDEIERVVPSGVGHGGRLELKENELDRVLMGGIGWAVEHGYATREDEAYVEENGFYKAADASLVSQHAKVRGRDQLGTIGAGNHFLEVQEVVEVFDTETADAFGLFVGQVTVMIHTGSRGLGHQTCTDYVRLMNRVMPKYRITLSDRELACAPFSSPEGQSYFKAMAASANFAWMNRQIITHNVRGVWGKVLKSKPSELAIVYDVAHNIAKLEEHNGIKYIIHRKGATRAFGPQHQVLPHQYQKTGQPVLIPGSMGTYSYVLAGTQRAFAETFGSACHGAGRQLSRTKAKRTLDYSTLTKELEAYGVVVRAKSKSGLLEEAPNAYKNIEDVVAVVHESGIARKIAKLKPIAIIKG